MTLADRFDQWATQYERKGESLVLQRQLVRRFGALPTAIVSRISSATAAELELWLDRVLDAATLDAIFLD